MKIFGRILLFLLGLILLTQGLAAVAEHSAARTSDQFFRLDQQNWRQLMEGSETIESIAVGSSHAGAIHFETLGENGHVWARASSDLRETAYILDALVPRLPALKKVYLPLSYFSLEWETTGQDIMQIRRTQLYSTIPSWRMMGGDLGHYVLGKTHGVFPIRTVVREDNWKEVFAYLLFAVEAGAASEDSTTECITHVDLAANEIERAASHLDSTRTMKTNRPKLTTELPQALADAIQYLQAQGVEVILFTPPYSGGYTAQYLDEAPESIAQMRAFGLQMQAEYGVAYYDFSAENSLVHQPELFKDADHLNLCGRQAFSELFKIVLNQSNGQ